MNVIGLIASVLLTIVGYSCGVTVRARMPSPKPRFLDLALVTTLCLVSMYFHQFLPMWAAPPVGLMVGGMPGLLLAKTACPRSPGSARALSALDGNRVQGWRVFLAAVGNYQGRMLLAYFYFLVLGPFAVVSRLASDRLMLNPPRGSSFWVRRGPSEDSVESARQQ